MLQTTTNPKDPIHFDTLLKGDQVARILNVSRSYAFLLMQRDEIPTVRIGRAVRIQTIGFGTIYFGEHLPHQRIRCRPSANGIEPK